MDAKTLKRYAQLAAVLAKYGRRDFLEAINTELDLGVDALESATDGGRGPDDLVADITELGPTFIKLGQMLSTRGDLLSEPYLEALASLQDDVAGLDIETVNRVLDEELPARQSQVFSKFEAEPIAAASLSQVHAAELRDGRRVVVKVQRPTAKGEVLLDLDILSQLAQAVDRHTETGRRFEFSRLVEHFRDALLEELDYRKEANNLTVLAEELSEFDQVVVPAPIQGMVTEKVLVMEHIEGTSVSGLGPLARMEQDFSGLARTLCEVYLHQILVAGFFQSDPHPGNILVMPDGRLALIDLGMVAHIESSLRERLLRLVLALCEGKGRETAELAVDLGRKRTNANVDGFVQQVGNLVTKRQHDASADRKLGRTLLEIVGIFIEHDIRPPVEIGLLGKTLLLLDEVAQSLDPDFDPDAVMGAYAQKILQRHMLGKLSPNELAGKLLDSGAALEDAPRRANAILKAMSRGEFRIIVDALDEESLLRSLERIGNRIALGVVLAALIVGAALIMSVETRWTLFGYPALAIVLFLAAAVFGLLLAAQIMLAERREKRQRRNSTRA